MEHYPAVIYILTDRAIKTLLHTHIDLIMRCFPKYPLICLIFHLMRKEEEKLAISLLERGIDC